LDVGVPCPGEQFRGNLLGGERRCRTEVGAHGAAGVRSDQGEAAPGGSAPDEEARSVAPENLETLPVKVAAPVAADLSDKGGLQSQPGCGKRGVSCRSPRSLF